MVAKWNEKERLPAKIPGFKRIAFSLFTASNGASGMRQLLDSIRARGWSLSERAIDLATIAFAVYSSDIGIPRALGQDSWTREISLDVPVSAPATWEGQRPTLTQLLNYLTGDRWFLRFRTRDTLPQYNVRVETSDARTCSALSLFSGGLDSLVGVIDTLARGEKLLCISHAGDGLTSSTQHDLLARLGRTYVDQLDALRIWHAPGSLIEGSLTEKTTRARSFLFFGAAVVAASTQDIGSKPVEVLIPENGFISLNVPLDPLRLGAHSTRTTHPFVIHLWNELLKGLQLRVAVRNPYQFLTKGEMLRGCSNQPLLRSLLPQTMSCSSPTKARWKGQSPRHCGHCVPCIIRRAAVQKAFGVDATKYMERFKRAVDPATARGRNVRAFQRAIAVNSKHQAASIVVHSAGPLPRGSMFADTYIRGLAEVDGLVNNVVTRRGKN